MTKQNVLRKAKEILDRREKMFNEFKMVLSAGICPTCGEDLILRAKEWTTKERRGFILKKEIEVSHKCDRFACPDGHSIVDPEGCDRGHPVYIGYDGHNNPNKIIRDYWLRYYCDDDDSFVA